MSKMDDIMGKLADIKAGVKTNQPIEVVKNPQANILQDLSQLNKLTKRIDAKMERGEALGDMFPQKDHQETATFRERSLKEVLDRSLWIKSRYASYLT